MGRDPADHGPFFEDVVRQIRCPKAEVFLELGRLWEFLTDLLFDVLGYHDFVRYHDFVYILWQVNQFNAPQGFKSIDFLKAKDGLPQQTIDSAYIQALLNAGGILRRQ